MELVGHDFYLFSDADTGQPSVVYRRHAYDYGLIRLGERAAERGHGGRARVDSAKRTSSLKVPSGLRSRRGPDAVRLEAGARRRPLRGDVAGLRAEFEPGEVGHARTPTATSRRSARVV